MRPQMRLRAKGALRCSRRRCAQAAAAEDAAVERAVAENRSAGVAAKVYAEPTPPFSARYSAAAAQQRCRASGEASTGRRRVTQGGRQAKRRAECLMPADSALAQLSPERRCSPRGG